MKLIFFIERGGGANDTHRGVAVNHKKYTPILFLIVRTIMKPNPPKTQFIHEILTKMHIDTHYKERVPNLIG